MMRVGATAIAVLVLFGCGSDDPAASSQWRAAYQDVAADIAAQGGFTALLSPLSGASIAVSASTSPLLGMSFQAGGTRQRSGAGEYAALVVKPFLETVSMQPEGMALVGNPVEIQVLQLPSKEPLSKYFVEVSLPFPPADDDDPLLRSAFHLENPFVNLFDKRIRWDEQHTAPQFALRTVNFEGGPGIYAAAIKDRATLCVEDSQINCFPETLPAEFTTSTNVPLLDYPVPATDADGKLIAAALRPPAHGDLILLSSGTFSYTPDSGFAGADYFTFFVTDGYADPVTGTVRIRIE